jgi:uncharacterized membrane protein YphA (DoxX/SURF4 family)
MDGNIDSYPGFIKRAGFFFLFSYFLLCIAPLPLEDLFLYFGRVFFSLNEVDVNFNGSGDKTYNYLEFFTHVLLAIPLSSILLISIKKGKVITVLAKVFYILVRYYLAWTLFGYGISKIFYQQFVATSLYTLDQKVGTLSPMGLAWTFMGHSRAYTMFSGYLEVIAGILLLFRRTSLLGAIVSFCVMLNIMAMNMCYDIPVKIFSMHLVFWSFLLMFGFDKRLLNFILQRPVEPAVAESYFKGKSLKIAVICIKSAFFLALGASLLEYMDYNDTEPRSLKGIYLTKSFIRNGDTLEVSDSLHWQKLIVDRAQFAIFRKEDGKSVRMNFKVDTVLKKIDIETYEKKPRTGVFSYELRDSVLTLRGTLQTDSLNIVLKQFDHNSFTLNKRGFHWVNEYPYNR